MKTKQRVICPVCNIKEIDWLEDMCLECEEEMKIQEELDDIEKIQFNTAENFFTSENLKKILCPFSTDRLDKKEEKPNGA